MRAVDAELPVRDRGEGARLLVGRAALLRLRDLANLSLVHLLGARHELDVLLEGGRGVLRGDRRHALTELLQVLHHLGEEADVACHAVFTGEMAVVAREHEVRRVGEAGEVFEIGPRGLRLFDGRFLGLVDLEVRRGDLTKAREIGPLRGGRNLPDLGNHVFHALDERVELIEVTRCAGLPREARFVDGGDAVDLLPEGFDERACHGNGNPEARVLTTMIAGCGGGRTAGTRRRDAKTEIAGPLYHAVLRRGWRWCAVTAGELSVFLCLKQSPARLGMKPI